MNGPPWFITRRKTRARKHTKTLYPGCHWRGRAGVLVRWRMSETNPRVHLLWRIYNIFIHIHVNVRICTRNLHLGVWVCVISLVLSMRSKRDRPSMLVNDRSVWISDHYLGHVLNGQLLHSDLLTSTHLLLVGRFDSASLSAYRIFLTPISRKRYERINSVWKLKTWDTS